MKSIKFNPFNAMSILYAFFFFCYIKDTKGEELEFFPTLEVDDEDFDVKKFYEEKNKEALADVEEKIYTRESIFRLKKIPLLLWGVSNKGKAKNYKPELSKKARLYVITAFAMLRKASVRQQFLRVLRGNDKDLNVSVNISGDLLTAHPFNCLLENEDVVKLAFEKFMKRWDVHDRTIEVFGPVDAGLKKGEVATLKVNCKSPDKLLKVGAIVKFKSTEVKIKKIVKLSVGFALEVTPIDKEVVLAEALKGTNRGEVVVVQQVNKQSENTTTDSTTTK